MEAPPEGPNCSRVSVSPPVGIDLGTTNSAIAFVEDGKPVCVPVEGEHRTIPSVVSFLPNDEVLVGR